MRTGRYIRLPMNTAPDYIVEYFRQHSHHSYLLAGLRYTTLLSGQPSFDTCEDCDVFQKRVSHLRMRNEMKEIYDKMSYSEMCELVGPITKALKACPCNCSVFTCLHLPYEEVAKLHDIIVSKKKEEEKEDGPPPLVSCPSDESIRKYKDLPKNVQTILFPKGGEVVFDTREECDVFEKKVEEEIVGQEEDRVLSFFDLLPAAYSLEKTAQAINESKKKVGRHPLSERMHRMSFSSKSYSDRVTCLLHSVATLAAQNKSLTQELVGSSLQTFASFLVKTRVEEGGLKMFEDTIRVATDSKNPFSLLFANYDKLTPPQKCIVKGLLGIMNKKEGEPWIHDAATQCLLLKEDGVDTQVLMEFLK